MPQRRPPFGLGHVPDDDRRHRRERYSCPRVQAACDDRSVPDVAFVLGGGGLLGASEVGMLRALVEADVEPTLVVGTSVGAINGAAFAAQPTADMVERLEVFWSKLSRDNVFGGSALRRVSTLARTGTHAHAGAQLRDLLANVVGEDRRIEQLPVRFQCVAAHIERAAECWFDRGPLVDAVMASSAVPGLLPPVEIDGQHYLDGGLVHSIPVGRAVRLGARTVFVLHVGRIERPLQPPTKPWEVAAVAFEIARRHRFAADIAEVPEDVTVHVLPTGDPDPPQYANLAALRYRDTSRVAERIELAHQAAASYLARL
ncbi:MAG: patatin-like phospholipase family protein [Jiangellaceae bacterium]|nr:patatin-like phospholipase family protein [Jiangellaceae bacterium]